MGSTFVVVNGGSAPHPAAARRLPADRFVIAADSGLDHAEAMGLDVDLVVGDLDSVSAAALRRAEAKGTPIERHPADKDAVDLELALDAARARGATRLVVLSGGGDRLDHVLAALGLLVHPALAPLDVEAWWGPAHVVALRGPATAQLDGPAGAYVSLLPMHGRAEGVTTKGLRFALDDGTLAAASSLGVSNELVGGPATVTVLVGALLVVRPDALDGVA
jgi:thiamine pyrophosphokinase